MAQHNAGREAEAFARLRAIRPQSWPNSRMVGFADTLLGRGGALMAALREHYVAMARAYPLQAAMLKGSERAAEVPDL
jgi:predicted protein tyrosine phosphatase